MGVCQNMLNESTSLKGQPQSKSAVLTNICDLDNIQSVGKSLHEAGVCEQSFVGQSVCVCVCVASHAFPRS